MSHVTLEILAEFEPRVSSCPPPVRDECLAFETKLDGRVERVGGGFKHAE
jgi:hypothetical protein